MVLEKLLSDAKAARLADDYETAMRLARAVIAATPGGGAPEAESLLGVCEIETGDVASGGPRVEAAAAARPDNAWLQINLCVLREAQGDLRGAVIASSRAAEIAPGRYETWTTLGKILGKAGKFKEAADALKRAYTLNRDHAGVAMLYAGAATEADDLEGAVEPLQHIERAAPGSPETLKLRVNFSRKIGDWPALERAAAAWLEREPASEDARSALAHALSEQGFFDRAADVYLPLAKSEPPSADRLATLGRMMLGARRLENAGACFEGALNIDPRNAEALFGLARRHMFLGKLDLAEKACRAAIALDPANVDAWAQLCDLNGGRLSDEEFAALEALAAAPAKTAERAAAAQFALGDALHRRKDRARAFEAWSKANAGKAADYARVGADYDPATQEAVTARIKALFSEDPDEDPIDYPSGEAVPIFIVGMPRSGTTLLESALAAHRDVAAAGEVPALPFLFGEFLDWASASGWAGGPLPERKVAEWRAAYFAQRAKFVEGAGRFITDKQPSNFLAAGFIRHIFPDAPIIHIQRNPIDCGFSIFRRNFTRQWPFTTSLSSIGHYFGEQAHLARHWARALGPHYQQTQYEFLVAEFEPEIRRILEAAGLDWDPDCLNYREKDRAVMTFSAVQVRRPLGAVEREAAAYADYLDPLLTALKRASVNLETGACEPRR